jgi:hypothetical protein
MGMGRVLLSQHHTLTHSPSSVYSASFVRCGLRAIPHTGGLHPAWPHLAIISTGSMTRFVRQGALALLLALGAFGQEAAPDLKLPSGKSQKEEILKADHEKNLKDAAALIELAGKLQQELEKNDRYVLSVSSIRKTEEIEKLAKRIRTRMRRF